MTENIIEITTTVETEEQAHRLARALVDTRLAACVQIVNYIRSHYRWKGQVCDGEEFKLSIKTQPGYEQRVLKAFMQHHPYELPEFIVTTVHASEAYAQWVREQVDAAPTHTCSMADLN
jgi:periplasmic divalent cation tolerance protein